MDEKTIRIPGWKIIRVIGAGSYGCVYEVEKEGEFGAVAHSALKVIRIPETDAEIKAYRDDGYDNASLTKLFKSRVEDITAEFELMSKLKGDSHIVSYEDHSIVQHEDDPGYDIYIRMELLTALPDYINRRFPNGTIPDAAVIKIGADICSALERCGQHSIIHRDIKPQNIFVNDSGDIKLGDFGIAKTSDHTTKATKTGTYGYMAPEVYWGSPYNASVDIYSLGVVLYWLLNERRGPFFPLPPEVPTSVQSTEALDRRMHGEALPAPKHGSEELKRIVLKACAFNPKDRYRNPTEMRRDLSRLFAQKINAAGNGTVRVETAAGTSFDPNATIGLFSTGNAGNQTARRENTPGSAAATSYETVFCPYCGKRQRAGSQFCTFCGNQIYAPKKQTRSTVQTYAEKPKKDSKRIWIAVLIAAILTIGIVIAVLLLAGNNCSVCGRDEESAEVTASPTVKPRNTTPTPKRNTSTKPPATPTRTPATPTRTPATPTRTPSTPTPTPATPTPPLFITEGEIRLKTHSGEYLKVGAAKTNNSGNTGGYYLEKTRNRDEAIVFRVIRISGNTVELKAQDRYGHSVRNSNGEDCYLEAYNPDKPEKYRGVDIWHAKNESSKQWIIEWDNGAYLIHMTGKYAYLYVTDRRYTDVYNEKFKFDNPVTLWEYEGSNLQEWYVEIG